VREPLVAHEAGEAGLAHAAISVLVLVGMLVKLAAEPRVIEATQDEHQRVRHRRLLLPGGFGGGVGGGGGGGHVCLSKILRSQ